MEKHYLLQVMAMALMSGALFIVGTTAGSVHYLEAQPNNKIDETRSSWPRKQN
jgi:hypothetical protein